MKNIKMLLILCCLLLLKTVDTAQSIVYAEDYKNKGDIYIDNIKIDNDANILIQDNEMIIPLRTVLEGIGSKVEWEENTGNIYFDYKGIDYVCVFKALNPDFPENKNILISEAKNQNSIYNSDYISLNPMSAEGSYCMINDRTYLKQQTGQYLLKALGCDLEINIEEKTLKITTK